ncbi:MAG: Gfo/Idh/MocA family protein [Mangrovibacterium sp.]
MAELIRWGILSTSKIGVQKVVPAIQKSSLGRVTAICSRNIDQAVKVAGELAIEKAYGSYNELLSDPDVDAIYNPLPNHLHVEWTLKSLAAGKHVLCEKPIGLSKQEAEFLAAEAAKYPQLKVMEAFMYRFHPQWQKVKELIASGAIGTVKTMQCFFSYYNTDPNNIRNNPEIGGGALMDIGCYCISFPRFIYHEEPRSVFGIMELDPVMGTDRLTSGILHFSNGKTATFTCSTQLVPFQRLHIFGTDGQLVIDIPVNAPPLEKTRVSLLTKTENREIWFDAADQYSLQADAFAHSVLNKQPVPTPLTDAIANMAVIDAIRESAVKKCLVNLNTSSL